MKYKYEHNLPGVIVTLDDGRACNFQLERFFTSGKTEPDFILTSGDIEYDYFCEFSKQELSEMLEFLRAQPDVRQFERAFTKAFYKGTLPDFFKQQIYETA